MYAFFIFLTHETENHSVFTYSDYRKLRKVNVFRKCLASESDTLCLNLSIVYCCQLPASKLNFLDFHL